MNLLAGRAWLGWMCGPDRDSSDPDSSGAERGASLVEYLLLLILIAIAVMGAIILMGGELTTKFSEAGSTVSRAPNP